MTASVVVAGFMLMVLLIGFAGGLLVHSLWQQWADGGRD